VDEFELQRNHVPVDDPPKAEAQGGDEIKEEQLWQKSRK
jgi:hypothetical protein